MDGDEVDAEQLGVTTALERTCALEARLRQAIQDTHAFSNSFDHDTHLADRERDALTAVTDQLELLEEKLREYRALDHNHFDDKTIVLSQLDNLRRELITISSDSLRHVFFAKDVVREVQAFAEMRQDDDSGSEELANEGAAAPREMLHVVPDPQAAHKSLDAQLAEALNFNDFKEASAWHNQHSNGVSAAADTVSSHEPESYHLASAADSILMGSAGRSSAQRLATWHSGSDEYDASSSARTPTRTSTEARPAASSSESSSNDPQYGGRLDMNSLSSSRAAHGDAHELPPHSPPARPRIHESTSRAGDDESSVGDVRDSTSGMRTSRRSSTLSSMVSAALGAAIGAGIVLFVGGNESEGIKMRRPSFGGHGRLPPVTAQEEAADTDDQDVLLPALPTLPFPDVNLGRG